MAKRTPMQRLARWHIWLGWIAAIPLLLWTLSGLFMALRPIEEVRGGELRAEPAPIDASSAVMPVLPLPVSRLALIDSGGRAVWVATLERGEQRRFSAGDGKPLGPVEVNEARILAERAFAGDARLTQIRRFAADQAPLDLRRPRPSWQATFADGTHLYLDADTGEVLALRTGYWRAYDFMWGLHIMDPLGRENSSHWLLWLFGSAGLVTSLFGSTLLFRRRRMKKT